MNNTKNKIGLLLIILLLSNCFAKGTEELGNERLNLKNKVSQYLNTSIFNIIPVDSIFCDLNKDSFTDATYIFKLKEPDSPNYIAFLLSLEQNISDSTSMSLSSNLIPISNIFRYNIHLSCDENNLLLQVEEESAHPLSFTTLNISAIDDQVLLNDIKYYYRDYTVSENGLPFMERMKHFTFRKKRIDTLNLTSKDNEVFEFENLGVENIPFETYQVQFNELYSQLYADYKKNHFEKISSIVITDSIRAFLNPVPIYSETINQYNDIAFFLEQAGSYEDAAFILEKVIEKFPDRTVAYINLGDSYWGLEEKQKAKKAYQTYISLMKKSGKEARIPKRVYERVQ